MISRKRKEYLIFGSPRIENDDINEVIATLKSGWISTGPRVKKFERLFKDYIRIPNAVALNSCTAGLHLSLLCANIRPGDEVITSPLTFAATANVIVNMGATPVFVDVDKRTMNIDTSLIEKKITPKTRVIIPVHLSGRPCEMDDILTIAQKYNLFVIEDAAHAIEAKYHKLKIGAIGDATAFSFYVTKNIAAGEGGMVTTRHNDWADKMRILSLHGLSKSAWNRYSDENLPTYQVLLPGFKYNMMDLQAALAINQLRNIDNYWRIRNEIWHQYDKAFIHLPLKIPELPAANTTHARHLYTILLDTNRLKIDRDTFKRKLHEENIGSGIHFTSLHLHPYYRRTYGFFPDDFPNATYISQRTISLPLSAKLTKRDVDDVIKSVRKLILANIRTEYFQGGIKSPWDETDTKAWRIPVQKKPDKKSIRLPIHLMKKQLKDEEI